VRITRRRLGQVVGVFAIVAGALGFSGLLPSDARDSNTALTSGPYVIKNIHDGDSFNLQAKNNAVVRIRIAGIDAPERTQPYAQKSKAALEAMLNKGPIRLDPVTVDRFGRWVANVYVNDTDIGLAMVNQGWAWYFRRYKDDLQTFQQIRFELAEQTAKQKRLGLWQGLDAAEKNPELAPEPPWQFRERMRKEK
jgi:endonuclease YncB( thermonuclease family)